MEQQIGWILWLAGTVVLINFIIYVLTGIEAFRRALRKESGVLAQVVLAVLFGGFAVLSTYLGPRLASGAIVNVRDSWPMAAGLAGGPIIGLGAGLIGGIHRFFLGGLTGVPCAIGAVLGGLLAGVVYKLNRNKLVGFWWALLFAALMEAVDMGLILLISRPFSDALAVVTAITVPMVVFNAVGVGVAQLIISRRIYR